MTNHVLPWLLALCAIVLSCAAPGLSASTGLYILLGDCYMVMLEYLKTTV